MSVAVLHLEWNGYAFREWFLAYRPSDPSNDPIHGELIFEGQSIFFVTLVLCQAGNLLTTRTRQTPVLPVPCAARPNVQPLEPGETAGNRYFELLLATTCSLTVALLVTDLRIMNARPVPILNWSALCPSRDDLKLTFLLMPCAGVWVS